MLANSRVQANAVNSPPLIPTLENKRETSSGKSQDAFVLFGMWREEAIKPLGPFVPEGI